MKKKKNFLFLLIFVFFLFFTRFYSLESFFSEVDDLISLDKLKYEKLNLYDIANDLDSPSYNSKIKIFLRELELKNNKIIDILQNQFSNLIFTVAPSKTSTYAPLQFFMFGWMLNLDQNFDQLKFYSRLPSAIFSILSVWVIYLISRKLFKENFLLAIMPSLLLTFSYPLIFISQRSYNYSAGVFAICLIFYLFLRENYTFDKKKVFINNSELKIKKNFYFSIILACTSYLSYLCIVLMPSFFIFKFIKNFLYEKKIFSFSNYNLIICGLMYSILISPILLYMVKINLHNYGALDASGINNEYSIIGKEGQYFKFFLYNFYLIVSKNLSFFLDSFAAAGILQILIFTITLFGFLSVFKMKINSVHLDVSIIFILLLFYWCIFVSLNQTSFGPTRHLLWLTPFITIFFTLGIKDINRYFIKSKDVFYLIVTLLILVVFFLNFQKFLKNHKDLLNETKINNLINKYNVKYIATDPTTSQVCFMKSINIKINTCPKRYYRHLYHEILSEKILSKIKEDQGSIIFINYKFTKKNILDLKNNNFKKLIEIQNIEYLAGASPLYVAKQSPNYIKILIYN
jgi:hypothetical protein